MAGDFIGQIKDSVIATEKNPMIDEARGIVANMIGLTLRGAADAVVSDIGMLIEASKWDAVDGYVLALSRILSHERAYEMISKAFTQKGHKLPSKYSAILGGERPDTCGSSRLIGR